jgi:hypothetical protein
MAANGYRIAALVLVLLFMCACMEGGQARASEAEVSGTYVADFETGKEEKEELTLNIDKSYSQVFTSSTKNVTNRGTWESSNDFLGPTEILLVGAVCPDDDNDASWTHHCSRNLVVHRKDGHLRLARNESFDLYYEREH